MRREPMTPRQAAVMVGKDDTRDSGRWMRRYLLRREREIGRQFATRLAHGEHSRLMVSESMLRRHCPELFSSQSEVERMMAEYRSEQERQLSETNARIDHVEMRLNLLGDKVYGRV
jgi:NhaP-type Na+/H+ and K+/H+ antiporter